MMMGFNSNIQNSNDVKRLREENELASTQKCIHGLSESRLSSFSPEL